MITTDEIVEIGKFNKTHGISGEISATLDFDTDNVGDLRCIVVDEDGIYVPFFIESYRAKNHTTTLLKIDGINSEVEARHFVGKEIYAISDDVSEFLADDDEEESAYSFIGYAIYDTAGKKIGEITDIDDSTDNYLFIVAGENGNELLVPIADEFVCGINDETQSIVMNLPEGLLEM